jgi:hypothetical protein
MREGQPNQPTDGHEEEEEEKADNGDDDPPPPPPTQAQEEEAPVRRSGRERKPPDRYQAGTFVSQADQHDWREKMLCISELLKAGLDSRDVPQVIASMFSTK